MGAGESQAADLPASLNGGQNVDRDLRTKKAERTDRLADGTVQEGPQGCRQGPSDHQQGTGLSQGHSQQGRDLEETSRTSRQGREGAPDHQRPDALLDRGRGSQIVGRLLPGATTDHRGWVTDWVSAAGTHPPTARGCRL